MKGDHNEGLKLVTVKIRQKCTKKGEITATFLKKLPVAKLNQKELWACEQCSIPLLLASFSFVSMLCTVLLLRGGKNATICQNCLWTAVTST